MANGDGDGFLWILAIGACIWAWSNHEKLKDERDERIFAVQRAETRSEDLKTRIIALEHEITSTKETANIAVSAVDAVSDQVRNNAKVANENAVKDMTRNGACGRETIYLDNGGWTIRNKECTVKDLKP